MALCIQIGCCCVQGAQKALDNMTEVDRLAKEASNSAQRCMEVGNTLKNGVAGAGSSMSPDPMMLMKIIPIFTDAKGYCDSMVGMANEVVQDAIQMVDRVNDAMDNCITGTCKQLCCAGGDGADASDPPPANVGPDIDDLERLKDAFLSGNLLAIATTGVDAVQGIEQKAGIIGTLTQAIIDFATATIKITSAIVGGNIAEIPAQVSKMIRCIRLSDMMKQFAEELLRLVNVFAELFKAMIDKLNSLNPLAMAGDAAEMAGDALGAVGNLVGAPAGLGKMF